MAARQDGADGVEPPRGGTAGGWWGHDRGNAAAALGSAHLACRWPDPGAESLEARCRPTSAARGSRALVRRVSPLPAQEIVTQLKRQSFDVGLAGEQWNGDGRALGWGLIEFPPPPTSPDSVFVKDTVMMSGAAVCRRELADTAGTLFVADATFFPHIRAMPEPAGSHVIGLGGDRLLIAASAPRSAELRAGLGDAPVIVDISEFEKLEGCVTCLSVRLRPGQSVPKVG